MGVTMDPSAKLVSIYVNEADEWRRKPLHLEILRLLHAEGFAGGTVVRAVAGFTGGGGVQTTSLVDAGGRLPLVVQFVESEPNVARVLPRLREMARQRLITIHDVEVVP
jgi:PII-like signaling protein